MLIGHQPRPSASGSNAQLADYAGAAIAFWKRESSGSANMIAHMAARQKQLKVVPDW